VIKSKVLRLNLPAEVDSTASKAQRSKTTGHLVLIMPKVNPDENALSIRVQARHTVKQTKERTAADIAKQRSRNLRNVTDQMLSDAGVGAAEVPTKDGSKKPANGGLLGGGRNNRAPTGGAVSIKGLVPARKGGVRTQAPAMSEVKGSTKILGTKPQSDANQQRGSFFDDTADDDSDDNDDDDDDDDEPPPAM
jgi:protein TilB